MSVIELIGQLADQQIHLQLNGDDLTLSAPKGGLTEDVLHQVRSNKAAVIAFLKEGGVPAHLPILPAGTGIRYPASPGQKSLWIIQSQSEGVTHYNMSAVYQWPGHLDPARFRSALAALVRRYEILRTIFEEDEGELFQRVVPVAASEPEVEVLDLSALSSEEAGEKAAGFAMQQRQTVFDLASGPLFRAGLIAGPSGHSQVAFTLHHIISDAWSMEMLMRELNQLYEDPSGASLPQLSIQFGDYVAWLSERLEKRGSELRDFWLDKFADQPSVLELPADFARPAYRLGEGRTLAQLLPERTRTGLLKLAAGGISSFSVLLAATASLLYRYTQQDDIVMGVPSSGRIHPDLQAMPGYFVNTLALRTPVKGEESFEAMCRRMHTTLTEAYSHEEFPFHQLVEELGCPADPGRSPLFNVMVGYSKTEQELSASVSAEGRDEGSKYDLSIDWIECGDGLLLQVNYDTALFTGERTRRMMDHLSHLLQEAVAVPLQSVREIHYTSPAEMQEILDYSTGQSIQPDHATTIISEFEAQVARTPGAPAVICEGRVLSYEELNRQANRVAHYLRSEHGIRPNDFVGLRMGRNERLMVALFGILKAGAAYVPIDPSYPSDRQAFMIEDSNMQLVLSENSVSAEGDKKTICWEDIIWKDYDDANPTAAHQPQDLAYLLYTSGSTGLPKGAMIRHDSVMNHTQWLIDLIFSKELPPSRALLTGTISFDSSVEVLFPPLLRGASLEIISEALRDDLSAYLRHLVSNKVEVLSLIPSHLHLLLQQAAEEGVTLSSLRAVVTGGELLQPDTARMFLEATSPGAMLINGYGPTEATVNSSFKLIDSAALVTASSIGRPVTNAQVWVMEWEGLEICGVGVPGEICIGGIGVSSGYWNRAELTGSRFIDHPRLGRLYRSGDRGAWSSDGELQFLGRRDDQVKVRGYRIELSEIEHHLLRHPAVREAVVVAEKGSGDAAFLLACVAWKGEAQLELVREEMSSALPPYMVPDRWIAVTEIPRLPNGKLDRRSIRSLAGSNNENESFNTSFSPLELVVSAAWKEVLGLASVGLHQNFFGAGGHSLKAMRLAAHLYRTTGVKLVLKEIFQHPTIAGQAQLIKAAAPTAYDEIRPAPAADLYELSHAQRRLWILSQARESAGAYHIFSRRDWETEVDATRLSEAMRQIAGRHEILRTSFIQHEGEVFQRVHPIKSFNFTSRVLNLDGQPEELEQSLSALAAEDIEGLFDLEQGPLFRYTLARLPEGRSVFLFTIHHIIADAWSLEVLLQELHQTYYGETKSKDISTVQYKDFAYWHNRQLETPLLQIQRNYWIERFSGELPVLELPLDRPRPKLRSFSGQITQLGLKPELMGKMDAFCERNGGTSFSNLLALVATLLYRYTGQNDLVLGIPLAGREHRDLEQSIGFYVNTVALRTCVAPAAEFGRLASSIHADLLEAMAHQLYPFDSLVGELDLPADRSRTPLFDVLVNHDRRSGNRPVSNNINTHEQASSKFDLMFHFAEYDNAVDLILTYNSDIFDAERIDRLMVHFSELAYNAMEQSSCAVSQLRYLPKNEEARLLQYSVAEAAENIPRSVVEAFESSAHHHPDHPVLRFGRDEFTYRQLNESANRIAYVLHQRGIGRGHRVGVRMERSPRLIITILGVVKCGAAYVPLDPTYPPERNQFIAEDSAISLLITDGQEEALESTATLYWKELNLEGQPSGNPVSNIEPGDLAYLIYTSGSTGTPKGVAIAHGALTNLTSALRTLWYEGVPPHTVLITSSICFDVSVGQLFTPLACGSCLVVITEEQRRNPIEYWQAVAENEVSLLDCTPSFLSVLLQSFPAAAVDLPRLTHVVSAGEALSEATVGLFYQHFPSGMRLINAYGPTESCVYTAATDVRSDEPVTIGHPLPGYACFILDGEGALCGTGIPGDLWIGGASLAQGYWKRAEATAAAFVEHPRFGRIYRSGDLASWNTNGTIRYEGRRDFQVKIRGYRIELGEIEACLLRLPTIREAVVLPVGEEFDQLGAFVVGEGQNVGDWLLHLRNSLPDFMVPSFIETLESMPKNGSGKIDRQALKRRTVGASAGMLPQTANESALAAICAKFLQGSISMDRSFFELGGHSLKAMRLVAEVHQRLGVHLRLADVFESPDLRDLARRIGAASPDAQGEVQPAPVQASYPLSHAQLRIWLQAQQPGLAATFNILGQYNYNGPLSEAALQGAIDLLSVRYEILRTVFVPGNEGVVQEVLPPGNLSPELQVFDLSGLPAAEKIVRLEKIAREESSAVFDLENGPLYQISLARLDAASFRVIVTMHHIISDAWSMKRYTQLLTETYQSVVDGLAEPEFPRYQYKDFTWWEQHLPERVANTHRAFWMEKLEGESPQLDLPLDTPRLAVPRYQGKTLYLPFDASLTKTMRGVQQQEGCSMFSLLAAATCALLGRYTGTEQLVIGLPVAGRPLSEFQGQLGCFINTVILKAEMKATKSFSEALQNVHAELIAAYDHSAYPFDRVMTDLGWTARTPGEAPFSFLLNYDRAEGASLTAVRSSEPVTEPSNFDWYWHFTEFDDGVLLAINYDSDIFSDARMSRVADHFTALLHSLVQNPGLPLRENSYVTEPELRQLKKFQPAPVPYRNEMTLHAAFEQRAAQSPEAIALLCEDRSMSFGQLNAAANRLAHLLIQKWQVRKGDRVGISLARNETMIVAIWGILKAGAAYVPIDPLYPTERRSLMADDAGVRCVVCDGPDGTGREWSWSEEELLAYPESNPDPSSGPEDLCYLIYTSGSTGEPKAVAVQHRSVMNLSDWLIDEIYAPHYQQRILLTASIGFDGSVKQIFPTLLHGLTLVLISEEVRLDPEAYLDTVVRLGVQVLDCTPSYLQLISQVAKQQSLLLPRLQMVLVGGEKLQPETSALFFSLAGPHAKLYNLYGPTETCVDASFKVIYPEAPATASSIGRPVTNAQVWVLEWEGLEMCGIGVPGEICIGGAGVSSGYWNRPELTQARFIDHPHLGRLYRSGDRGAWSSDGELQFLGRRDGQVKVRGYRIELSEIEHHLLRHPAVREAAVVAEGGSGEPVLTALIVWQGEPAPADLRQSMEQVLPFFMVPSKWVSVPELPRTASGKVKRNKLPSVQEETEAAVAPDMGNELEQKLQRIWQELLGRRVSIDQRFFEIGGHSLKAMLMLPMVFKEMGVRIHLKDIYQHSSIRELATFIAGREQRDGPQILPLPEAENYPASPAQVQLWSVHQMEQGRSAYNILHVYGWDGELDAALLKAAVQALCERHQILRTVFIDVEGEPRQVVKSMESFELPLRVVEDAEHGLSHSWLDKESAHVFSLEDGPLFRIAIGRRESGGWQLVVHLHHIISDAWSMELMVRELREAYAALSRNEPPFAKPLPFQYRDFARWHQQLLEGEELAASRIYWLQKFEAALPDTRLPADLNRPAIKGFRGKVTEARLGETLTASLRRIARQENCSMFTVLFSGLRLLLQRYTGEDDLVIGVPLAGRDVPGLEGQLGYFVNTVPLRTQVPASSSFLELVDAVKSEWLLAQQHQWYPFHMLVDELELPHDPSRTPLFDVLVNYNRSSLPEVGEMANTPHRPAAAKFDLVVHFTEGEADVSFSITYDAALFLPVRIDRMMAHLQQVFHTVVEQPQMSLSQCKYLTALEEEQLLNFNPEPAPVISHTLQAMLRDGAQSDPSAAAVCFGERVMSYAEFDATVNRLARYLRDDLGVRPNDRVGILLQRSERLPLAIHAVVRAGAAYVPLDTAHPASRIDFMVRDSGARLVISELPVTLAAPSLAWSAIPFEQLDASPLPEVNSPDDLLYVLYTSGSTGTPKGVCIPHRAFLYLLDGLSSAIETKAFMPKRVLLTASTTFDVSVAQLFLPLVSGSALVMIDEETRMHPSLFAKALVRYGVESMDITPSYLHLVLQAMQEEGISIPSLRQVLAAGEAFPSETLLLFNEVLGTAATCYNLYGPTEACIYTTACRMNPLEAEGITIGVPLPNYSVHILDEGMNSCGLGLSGEICIGGAGLATGYCNQEELTRQRFIHHPQFGRLYRSGDVGRWNDSGQIEYMGRKDAQVKLNGMRVELGEIEAVLQQFESIREAAVILAEVNDVKQLSAFLVWKGSEATALLQSHLADHLPHGLVPRILISMDALPRTTSGKLDRIALLKEPALHQVQTTFISPETPTEVTLSFIWSEVLNRDSVGAEDNFFYLGGHSLKAMRLISRIQQELQVTLAVRDIFEAPTVRLLARRLEEKESATTDQIPQAPRLAYYGLSHAQRRLWLVSSLSEVGTAYTMFETFYWKSPASEPTFRRALQYVVQRHESLRTVFAIVDGVVYQKILKTASFTLPFAFHDLSALAASERDTRLDELGHAEAHRAFNLEKGPLFQCTLVRLGEDDHVLMFSMHHIISDAWSLQVLRRELSEAYVAVSAGRLPDWTPLRIQYKDFAHWQNGKDAWEGHRAYWHGRLQPPLPVLGFPADSVRPPVKTFTGKKVLALGGYDALASLKEAAHKLGCSHFTLLLASVQALLHRYTGDSDLIIGIPVAGRQNGDLQGQIGFFVNTIALRSATDPSTSFGDLAVKTGQELLDGYSFQDYPMELIVDELKIETDRSRSPMFDVMANYDRQESPLANPQDSEFQNMVPSVAKFDFVFHTVEYDDNLMFSVSFNSDIYTESRARRLLHHWVQLLRAVCANPYQPIGTINYLDANETAQLRALSEGSFRDHPLSRTLPDLFEETVQAYGEKTAIAENGLNYTYRELNDTANKMAHYLREVHRIGTGDRVGLMMHRGANLVAAMLGILKAGGAYVPIDPLAPPARVDYQLADSGAKTVISDVGLYSGTVPAIYWKDGAFNSFPSRNPVPVNSSGDLCYVIYTSGSTGMPKGVMISHASIVNLCCWHRDAFSVTPESRGSWYAGLSFDASVWEIFPYLLCGACIYPVQEELRHQVGGLQLFMRREGITHAFLPTPVFEEFATLPKSADDPHCLLTGGEQLKSPGNRIDVVNNYGPTECAVVATTGRPDGKALTIGRPIDNVQILILDASLQPVPVGVYGEICIGGAGIGLGYLNLESMTASRFIDHPLEPGKKLFRSGDLGRWTEGGEIEFSGRRDTQVKLRGHRIDTAEVEAALNSQEAVSDARVLLCGTGTSARLVAFCTGQEVPGSVRQDALRKWLPEYMVPSLIITVERFPLTLNGKVDDAALRALAGQEDTGVRTAEPVLATETERSLALLWSEVLACSSLDRDDDFFGRGGHSLKAMRLITLVERQFGIRLSLRTLFEQPRLRDLAQFLDSGATVRSGTLNLNRPCEGAKELYLVPPIIGSSTVFHALARQLQDVFNCRGFQLPGFDDGGQAGTSVQAIAQRLHEQVQVPESNEIFLLGFSFGALVAFELVKLLEASGARVHLILVDRDAVSGSGRSIKPSPEQVREQLRREVLSWTSSLPDANPDHLLQLAGAHWECLEQYQLEGRVAANLFTFEALESAQRQHMSGWNSFTKGFVSSHYCPADHHGIIRHPALAQSILELALDTWRTRS